MVCVEPVDHTPLEEAHGNAGTCFSTSVTNCIWQYLNLLNKEQEGNSGAHGTHWYFSAALAPTEEQLLATLIVTEKFSKCFSKKRILWDILRI